MSKKNRRVNTDFDSIVGPQGAENLGLKPPFPASPQRPGRYCLYITKEHSFITAIYCEAYAARKFMDILLSNDEIHLTKGPTGLEDMIVSSSGISVRCDKIKELIDYEYNKKEDEWELGEPDSKRALRFRVYVPKNESVDKVIREKSPKKESKPRQDTTGMVSIGEIAAELKIEPREARAALRKSKTEKPDQGWKWFPDQVENIKEIIKKNLK